MKIKIVTWNMAYWSHKNLLSEVWDYFFISKKLSKKLLNCEIIDNDKNRKYSDHNPVIITLEI